LVLIDPVIGSPADYTSGSWIAERLNGALHPIAKRRNHWSSANAMFSRFKGRVPFSAFDRKVLRDYCEYGILPDPAGHGYVLACPPEFEAAVYMMSRSNAGVYDSIHAVSVPVLIVRAMEPPPDRDIMDFRYSPTFPGLVRHFKHGREVYLKDQTHFLPMEDPARVARYILKDERPRRANGKPETGNRK
jgi:lipase